MYTQEILFNLNGLLSNTILPSIQKHLQISMELAMITNFTTEVDDTDPL